MTPYYQDASITLYHGNCLDILPTLHTVDVVLIDPPYGEQINANLPGKILEGTKAKDAKFSRCKDLGYAAATLGLIHTVSPMLAALVRRWCLIFSDVESTSVWRNALTMAELRYVRTCAWVREGGSPQFSGDRPAAGFEAITITHNAGERLRWNGGGSVGVWTYPIARGDERWGHTTPKPLALMSRLVSLFSDPGETVLDCFAGVGATGVAAKQLGRKAILIEQQEQYCESTARRLAQEVFAFDTTPPQTQVPLFDALGPRGHDGEP